MTDQKTLSQRTTHFYLRDDIEKLKKIDVSLGISDIELRVRATAMPNFEPPYIKTENRKYYIIPEELYKTK